MFDIGWLELMVIGIVALIVVGPKDLPGMFRTVGNFVGKARGMAREFQRTMEAAADESGLKDAADTMKGMSDPLAQARDSMKDYSKNFVTEKDKKASATGDGADASPVESAGETLVKQAAEIASPAAKATAAKVAPNDPMANATAKAKAAKPTAKQTAPEASTNAATTKTPAKKPAAKAKS